MAVDRWLLLGRLKRAVNKFKTLLDLSANRWKLATLIRVVGGNKRLSFNDRPGLRAVIEDMESDAEPDSAKCFRRTISYPSEDDIDKKADDFIANFYKQLKLERQVSLEIKYFRGNSFDSDKSP